MPRLLLWGLWEEHPSASQVTRPALTGDGHTLQLSGVPRGPSDFQGDAGRNLAALLSREGVHLRTIM